MTSVTVWADRKYEKKRTKFYLLSPGHDLLNGGLSYSAISHNSVGLFEGFLSLFDRRMLPSVISVDVFLYSEFYVDQCDTTDNR